MLAFAKGETTRIEIARGKWPIVTLSGPATAGQFTIWSGPGTSAGAPGEPGQMSTSSRDFADWRAGAVEPPPDLATFKVRFFCAAVQDPPAVVTPSHQCYGVRYAIDPETRQGYIQIPPERDKDFPLNTQSIYRGVEGSWYRAAARWEMLVRPQLEAALAAGQPDGYHWYEQQHVYDTPAPTAVSAKPLVTPKK
jgi:hypothetical protein